MYPQQPIVISHSGIVRFKENRIVSALLDFATDKGFGLNEIGMKDFSQEERMQFAQLIGYSISGYGDLSYVSDESYKAADDQAQRLMEDNL